MNQTLEVGSQHTENFVLQNNFVKIIDKRLCCCHGPLTKAIAFPWFPMTLPWYAHQIRTREGHCSKRTDVSTTYAWGGPGLGAWDGGRDGNEDRSLLSGAVPGFWGESTGYQGTPTADAKCIELLYKWYLRRNISAFLNSESRFNLGRVSH